MIFLNQLKTLREKRLSRHTRPVNPSISGLNTIILAQYGTEDIERERKEMIQLLSERSIIDSTGTYHIIPHLMRAVIMGNRNFIRQDLGIVTHGTLSQLQHLDLMIQNWDGLVSVAVFVPVTDINLLLETILLMRRCSPLIRFKTSFHLVFPIQTFKENHINSLELASKVSCSLMPEFFCRNGPRGTELRPIRSSLSK